MEVQIVAHSAIRFRPWRQPLACTGMPIFGQIRESIGRNIPRQAELFRRFAIPLPSHFLPFRVVILAAQTPPNSMSGPPLRTYGRLPATSPKFNIFSPGLLRNAQEFVRTGKNLPAMAADPDSKKDGQPAG